MIRSVPARVDIVPEGAPPRALVLVLEGWACSYRSIENGKRQIIAFLLPGDLPEPFGILPGFSEYAIAALTPVRFARVSSEAVQAAAKSSPPIETALWWDLLVSGTIEREHIVSLGRRSASERLGHLLCELHLRLDMVELAEGEECDMPLTQAELADALGLSHVHVNRSLQDLRARGLPTLTGRRPILHDLEALQAASLFDPDYLHAEKPKPR